jgi:hypothetical protein
MLTAAEQAFVYRHGVASLHDHRVNSIVSGEPFLEHGMLSYFDGKALLVCGQSMRGFPPPAPQAANAVIREWVDRGRVDSLTFVGAEPIGLSWLRRYGFAPVFVQRRVPREAELFLPADLGQTRVMRRAGRGGFRSRCSRGGGIRAVHLQLTETFFRGYR